MTLRRSLSLAVAFVLALPIVAAAQVVPAPDATAEETTPPRRLAPWSDDTRTLAASLAIQDGARIKPLSTYARFLLLQLSGRTTLTLDPDGKVNLSAMDFALDCLFFQDQAAEYPVLMVEDFDVLDAVGLGRIEGKRKRDRYSYNDLVPCLDRLFEQARQIVRVEPKERTALQKQIYNLAQNVDALTSFMSWQALTIFPPPTGEEIWLSPFTITARTDRGEKLPEQRAELDRLTGLLSKRASMPQFAEALLPLHADLVAAATARGQYKKIPLEISFYNADWFFKARWIFAVAFVFCALVFLAPRVRALAWIARGALAPAWLLLAIGITIRCILRGRPPVSTLYETILFITAIAVFAALVVEWFHKKSIAQLVAAAIGYGGMSLASWYEEISATDTMPQLQAVLDTNFWLSTHVTCVTIGYAAGLLAAATSITWVIARTVLLLRGTTAKAGASVSSLTRATYGVLCFGVLFSTVGTILGGIWANESWGRFWGWDPKENGALMIVLAVLVILHARMGGYVRERGLHVLSILLGCVVVFSWFHTNQLGVGLHAYGFDERLGRLISWTYRTLCGFALLGAFVGVLETRRERARVVSQPTPTLSPAK